MTKQKINELVGTLNSKKSNTLEWLNENHPNIFNEQKHLDKDSIEQLYWHYGYYIALKDIIKKIEKDNY